MDNRSIVYGIASPRFHPPVCVSCGQTPFTTFHVQIYRRTYQIHPTSISLSPPRLLFTGPRGAQIILYSLAQGWLVYGADSPSNRWQLFARNIITGRIILLDSPAMEGLPNPFIHAGSDGRTVVWQSWARIQGQPTSVIRAYSLATGRRRLLLSGGRGTDYFYGYPQVSGNRVVLERESGNGGTPRILLDDLTTHHLRALTAAGQWNDEPAISGTVVAWVSGRLTIGHTHGVVVTNLATGRRIALKHSSAQLPRVTAGRSVVFATNDGHPSVQAFDVRTGTRRTLAAGSARRYPGELIAVSSQAVLFPVVGPCTTSSGTCLAHYTIMSLP
jgi:hypothetical protein